MSYNDLLASIKEKELQLEQKLASLEELATIEADLECLKDELANLPLEEMLKAKNLTFKVSGEDISNVTTLALTERKGNREDYRPSAKQLARINKVALEDQTEDSGYVFTLQATNIKNKVDRTYERFSDKALGEMAAKAVANTIPFLLASDSDYGDHAWKAPNVYGYVIEAEVKEGGLFYSLYVPKNGKTALVLEQIFSGLVNKLSVGFSMDPKELICDSCRKQIISQDCPHQPGMEDEKGRICTMTINAVKDNYEISAVAVPAQPEAHITRMMSAEPADIKNLTHYNGNPKDLTKSYGPTPHSKETQELIEKFDEFSKLNSDLFKKAGMIKFFSVSGEEELPFKEVTAEEKAEISDLDKINNGKNTIEDNSPMPDNKEVEQVVTESPAAEPAKEEVVTNLVETEIAEIKSQLAEVKELAKPVDLSELVSEVKALKEATVNQKAIEALTEKVEALTKTIAAAMTVPGSETVVDATKSGNKTASINPDSLLSALLQ